MTITCYQKGDLVRVTGTFTNSAGTAIDPTAVFFAYTNPAGTTTTVQYSVDAAVVKSATGVYYVDVNASSAGRWYWRWYATGTGQSAEQGEFVVEAGPA